MRFWRRQSEVDKSAEWRRKSVRLRDGEFLHGELIVEIQEARDLPDTDNFLFNIKRCFGQEKDVTDPYVAVTLDNTRIITTSVRFANFKKLAAIFKLFKSSFLFVHFLCLLYPF